jgi:hypothetical protein
LIATAEQELMGTLVFVARDMWMLIVGGKKWPEIERRVCSIVLQLVKRLT